MHIKKVEVYAPSLDASTHEACAHRILAATTTCGVEFVADMRARATSAELGLGPATGPLSQGVHQAGLKAPTSEDSNDHTPSCPRLQQALCEQVVNNSTTPSRDLVDFDLRQLPAIQTTPLGVVPDPRLASWAEICAIGRA